MIVVDVETTGMDPLKHSLLSIGAVDLENPDRQFYGECRAFEGAHVMDEALAVNGFTKEQVYDQSKQTDKELVIAFLKWALEAKNHMFAGHNPWFDFVIIRQTAFRYHLDFPLARRTLDSHSIAYAHMVWKGVLPPEEKGRSDLNLDAVLRYVGIPEEPRPHNGLIGAKVEAEAFSRLLYDKPLLKEFEHYPIPWLAK